MSLLPAICLLLGTPLVAVGIHDLQVGLER